MAQDHDGFMWFGTETGLSRYDGSRFKNFTTSDGLPENEIIQLMVDSKNRVWMLPFGNKICYFFKGVLHTEQNDSLLRQLHIQQHVASIVEDKKGQLAIVERNRLSMIDASGNVSSITIPGDSIQLTHAGLDFDRSIVVFGTAFNKSSSVFKPENGRLNFVEDITSHKFTSSNGLFYRPQVKLLTGNDSIQVATPAKQYFIPAPQGFINLSLLNDSLVTIMSLSKTYTYNFIRQREDRLFFKDKNITNAQEDNEGNLWFSSAGDGIYRLPSTRFKNWAFIRNGHKLPVYSLVRKKNLLWVGTEQFLLWNLDLGTGKLHEMQLASGQTSGRITSLVKYADDGLMVGTDLGPFYQEGDKIKKVEQYYPIKSMFATGDTVYLGAYNAVYYSVGAIPKFLGLVFFKRTTAVYGQNNHLYFGSLNGLYEKVGTDSVYLGGIHPALAGRISMITGSPDGALWLGTSGFGVVKYENGKVTVLLNTDSGLTSNIVRSLFFANNKLWVGTDKGLNKVERVQGRYSITRFTTADGLISNMINALHVEPGGKTVYVGTPEGLTYFDEDSVFTSSMCVLRITDIRSARQKTDNDTGHLQFNHYDNNFRFEFTGISFKSSGEIRYRYRLEGLNNEWDTTTDNFLLYPTLPSGEYTLQLQAINKFDVASQLISIPFSIDKLLWEYNWFRVLAIIIIAGVLWVLVSYRIKVVRRQEEAKLGTSRKIAALEQMALQAQMNPHFIFNSLNSIQHYVFEKDILGANKFITEFSRLIRMTMEISGKHEISLEDEIKYLSTYLELEKKRFENKFTFDISIDKAIDLSLFYIPPMILQPYVENGIRHGIRYLTGNTGIIRLSFKLEGDELVCSVEDNGIGRERSRQLKGGTIIEYQSQGMTLTARRIEMMNRNFNTPIIISISDIYKENEVAGTKVTIQIPMQVTTKA